MRTRNTRKTIRNNWQKEMKTAMIANRGFDKIMALIGRGIAVQSVKIAKGI